jgi:hypothetical protein
VALEREGRYMPGEWEEGKKGKKRNGNKKRQQSCRKEEMLQTEFKKAGRKDARSKNCF